MNEKLEISTSIYYYYDYYLITIVVVQLLVELKKEKLLEKSPVISLVSYCFRLIQFCTSFKIRTKCCKNFVSSHLFVWNCDC